MSAQQYISVPTSLVAGVLAKLAVEERRLVEAESDRNGYAIVATRAYVGVLHEAVDHLARVDKPFHTAALFTWAIRGKARLGSPRTWIQQQEQQSERRAYQWLINLAD